MPDPLRVLGFDTSAAHCAAAVVCGGRVLAERAEPMTRGQAERLFPLLEELLAEAGLAWADLDAIGVGIGPGNFTGVRISVAAARGLALALGIPAVGVSATEAAACGAPRPCRAVVALRGDEVVWQDFVGPGAGLETQERPTARAGMKGAGARGLAENSAPPARAITTAEQAGASGLAKSGIAPGNTTAAAGRAGAPGLAGARAADGIATSPDLAAAGRPAPQDHEGPGTAWPAPMAAGAPAGEAHPAGGGRAAGQAGPAALVGSGQDAAASSADVVGERSGAKATSDAREAARSDAGTAPPAVPTAGERGQAGRSLAPAPTLGRIDDLPPGPPVCAPLHPVAVAIARVAQQRLGSSPARLADRDAQVGRAAHPGSRPAPLYLRPADAAPPRDPPPAILR